MLFDYLWIDKWHKLSCCFSDGVLSTGTGSTPHVAVLQWTVTFLYIQKPRHPLTRSFIHKQKNTTNVTGVASYNRISQTVANVTGHNRRLAGK